MFSAEEKKRSCFKIHISAICQRRISPFSMFIYVINAKMSLFLSYFQFKSVHCFSSYPYVTHCLAEYNKWKHFVTPIFLCYEFWNNRPLLPLLCTHIIFHPRHLQTNSLTNPYEVKAYFFHTNAQRIIQALKFSSCVKLFYSNTLQQFSTDRKMLRACW